MKLPVSGHSAGTWKCLCNRKGRKNPREIDDAVWHAILCSDWINMKETDPCDGHSDPLTH